MKAAPKDGVIITVAGMRGSGKTTKVRQLVRRCRRLLVADPEGKWDPGDGEVLVTSSMELRALIMAGNLLDSDRAFRIVYRDHPNVVRLVAPGVAYALRRCTLVPDELSQFCTPNLLPDPLNNCLAFGREREINIVGTTREPQEIHDRFFSQADLVYFFHFEPGNGLERVLRRYGKLAAELPALGRFEYRVRVGAMGLTEEQVLARLGSEGRKVQPTSARRVTARGGQGRKA
jgi:hypothetical protein